MITALIIFLVFTGAVVFSPLPAMKNRLTCEQYENTTVKIKALDIKQHFYHSHPKRTDKNEQEVSK